MRRLMVALITVAASLGVYGAHGQTPPMPRGGGAIPYPAGWNLIAGFTGAGGQPTIVSGADEPLYTFQAGDRSYKAVPSSTPLQAGVGYWVHFSQPTSVVFPQGTPDMPSVTQVLPAGQFVMIGNPFPTAARVSGASIVYIYDPDRGYQERTTLQAGQGAWAFSTSGATITLSSTSG